ncbi:MAG: bifunctional phosphopantothenoylcysteine decarboxylase/phosphopantothenate--cysteine ligase CoaBC [Bacteroidetes bacterium]|nr:bifunctional phosphopantothenoylcysteine decarboxylase/phosphopantothenate--cysteine ligase CoaBC [Bacteroidota bacterium]
MKGKKILIGISGSIAAYKIPLLVRLCIKAGAEVKIVMTPSSATFVSPLVLSTLSKNEVHIDIASDTAWANHVELGRWADVMLIAPASCNTLAKMANAYCDNLLLSVYLSSICKIYIAPAMDEDMWHHQATQDNLTKLASFGHTIIPSEHGELASGLIGMGRMAEPETIFENLQAFFKRRNTLTGKTALITAGPTYENLDPVRFIGNYSTGKMGIAIAEALAERGCKVHLVLGPTHLVTHHPLIETTNVRSAEEMYQACMNLFSGADIAVMSAAVADYTPEIVAENKIKKQDDNFELKLKKTKDILKSLGAIKSEKQVLVGFALESKDEKQYALKKLSEKNADAIVMNSLNDKGAGFSHDTNKITIFEKSGLEFNYELKSKQAVANDIVERIMNLLP